MSSEQDPPLVLAPELQYPLQSRVVLCGLEHQQKLNGHLAVVEHFLWDQGRYQVRPLSRQARLLTTSQTLAVRPSNLRQVPPSAFVAKLTTVRGGSSSLSSAAKTPQCTRVPLECQVELDEQQEQLVVKLMISDFWGKETQQRLQTELMPLSRRSATMMDDPDTADDDDDDDGDDSDDDYDSYLLEIINTPIDYEEQLTLTYNPVELEGDELLIIPKNIFAELYDAMLDYELLSELDMTIPAGLHGELPLCRLRFPYQLGGFDGDDEDEDDDDTGGNPALPLLPEEHKNSQSSTPQETITDEGDRASQEASE
jgi:hypothetical protein